MADPQAFFYSMRNVYVYPRGLSRDGIPGYVSIVVDRESTSSSPFFFMWTPYYMLKDEKQSSAETAIQVVPPPPTSTDIYAIRIPLPDVESIKQTTSKFRITSLVIVVQEGATFPPFYFLEGGVPEFLGVLQSLIPVVRSETEPNTFYLSAAANNEIQNQKRMKQLQQEQNLSTPDTSVHPGNPAGFASAPQLHVNRPGSTAHSSPMNAPPEQYNSPAQKTINDISKVVSWGLEAAAKSVKLGKEVASSSFWPEDSNFGNDAFGGSMYPTVDPPKYTERLEDTDLGAFSLLEDEELLNKEDARIEAIRRTVSPMPLAKPLTSTEWNSRVDPKGVIHEVEWLRERIYQGGVEPSLRRVVWKFLLGYFPFDSTKVEREITMQQKEVEYNIYLNQWQSVTTEQEIHFSKFRSLKERIEKDVVRTDRTWSYYEDDDSPHLKKIYRILLSYSFFNFDIGYVQGMNDLVSVILIAMEGDEVDAFWCFKGLMDRMMDNFKKDQIGIHSQLTQLAGILKHLDPAFYRYLEDKSATNMFFCFRWILILFKREFQLYEIMRLWEVIWADHYTKHHHLFVCLAMLLTCKNTILSDNLEFDDLLRLMNEQSMMLSVDSVLENADCLYRQFVLACDEAERNKILQTKSAPNGKYF